MRNFYASIWLYIIQNFVLDQEEQHIFVNMSRYLCNVLGHLWNESKVSEFPLFC